MTKPIKTTKHYELGQPGDGIILAIEESDDGSLYALEMTSRKSEDAMRWNRGHGDLDELMEVLAKAVRAWRRGRKTT